jgi:hypothetical protein
MAFDKAVIHDKERPLPLPEGTVCIYIELEQMDVFK